MKLTKIPNHIAFIVDGNGRWAKKRNMPRSFGHKAGVDAVKKVIDCLYELNIKYTSFFVFSTENFKRSHDEIDYIFDLLREYLKQDIKDCKLVVSGDITKLPEDLQVELKKKIKETKNNDKLVVNLCLCYGGQQDIVNACNNIIKDKIDSVDIDTFKKYLYTKDLPYIDYVIRTSGEQRISNFMLFDLAYAELYFTKTYWPDFNKKGLLKALKEYQKRNRRFGNA